ncbi:hypothetical protein BD626DRAFT_626880 [Schizophyllum amplum]|uniref:Uncharacterized protein n=1 Tax=Schizophyllum amplum TaxID=97359 RepID=A0A550CUY2_9AGAR|nr:hypothetical protein BD626DRAFT_626880 [Auriculariopsis ampla]
MPRKTATSTAASTEPQQEPRRSARLVARQTSCTTTVMTAEKQEIHANNDKGENDQPSQRKMTLRSATLVKKEDIDSKVTRPKRRIAKKDEPAVQETKTIKNEKKTVKEATARADTMSKTRSTTAASTVTRAAKRKAAVETEAAAPPAKRIRSSTNARGTTGKAQRVTGGESHVRFDLEDGSPDLEPLSSIVTQKQRAKAVTIEFLASQVPDAPEGDVHEVTYSANAVANLRPKAKRRPRRHGRKVWRWPLMFVLGFMVYAGDLLEALNLKPKEGYGVNNNALDKVLLKQFGIETGCGVSLQSSKGRDIYMLVVSCSDTPETLPYPQARIRHFQETLKTEKLPKVLTYKRPDSERHESRGRK